MTVESGLDRMPGVDHFRSSTYIPEVLVFFSVTFYATNW